jgi:electron transfer flavoprotein alpha subunit
MQLLALQSRTRDVKIEQQSTQADERVTLEEAEVVVSGGRGLGGPEPFATMLTDLATVCGGAVGASRAVVDAGWVPHAQQVGQTGKTVRPKLYFAVAISGAIQHRVGMQTAGTIVAINKDAQIPMADIADLLVVGDAFAIIPELTRQIRLQKGLS